MYSGTSYGGYGTCRCKKVRTTASRKAVAADELVNRQFVTLTQNVLTGCGWLILLTSGHGGVHH